MPAVNATQGQQKPTLVAVVAGIALATRGRLGLPAPVPAIGQDRAAGS